eukprot:TRINITY_DN4949_c0_g1_i1.p1 TRINITY_DN4949_c0_g1~~TRINITY_DN4949_c0_g1_i1.p1  ORF type:complete len:330 (-),score=95.88 TRINITY_DN4949_c0_g1_i1:111-1043(-)
MGEKFVPFKDRPEWSDVEPLPQNEGPHSVCCIAYNDEFKETNDYFRAILQLDEVSERALKLTNEVIALNPANYTAWFYRRKCLFELESDLAKELQDTREVVEDNPKNYQVWYHRRALIEKLQNPGDELEFISNVLEEFSDEKNYHGWSHRQWILSTFNNFDNEFNYIDNLLNKDHRNNSVWNHRFYVVKTVDGFENEDIIQREIDFAFSWIEKGPNNESPWNYIRGLLNINKENFLNYQNVKDSAIEITKKFPSCCHSLALCVEFFERENDIDGFKECVEKLKNKDFLRSKYWSYREGLFNKKNNITPAE